MRTRSIRNFTTILLMLLNLSACAQGAPSLITTPTATGDVYIPVIAASELQVGQNRIAMGIIKNGTPINDPDMKPHVRFFYLDDMEDKTKVQSESDAIYRGEGLPIGLYISYPNLDRPGAWAAEVSIPRAGAEPAVSRVRLDVVRETVSPWIGTEAIPSKNLTVRDVPDLSHLTSDGSPEPAFYQMTIADAIAAKKPFVVQFSTPGYCKTAVCAPNIKVLKGLYAKFKDKVNFIHVEVYPYPFGESAVAGTRVPAMEEWHLQTEPWTFLVDAKGVIQNKYEGGITLVEMDPAIQKLIDTSAS